MTPHETKVQYIKIFLGLFALLFFLNFAWRVTAILESIDNHLQVCELLKK